MPKKESKNQLSTAVKDDQDEADRLFADAFSSNLKNLPATKQKEVPAEEPESVDDQMRSKFDLLSQMDVQDEITDDEALRRSGEDRPERLTAPQVSTTINQQLATTTDVEPDWSMIKHLPGYLATQVRALGRQVFGAFTSTPVEDITMIANIQDQGPNDARELNAVAGWLQKHGERDTQGELDFTQSLGDYSANIALYRASGVTFLVVNDFAGNYIYSWPTADDLGIEQDSTPRLGIGEMFLFR